MNYIVAKDGRKTRRRDQRRYSYFLKNGKKRYGNAQTTFEEEKKW